LISLIHASTAGQVMRSDSHRAAVKPDDSLAHVLRLMIELDLIVLPVVDKANRVVGDLKLSELLAAVIVVD
jgi:Mg/Co/Ni transporter MgtE